MAKLSDLIPKNETETDRLYRLAEEEKNFSRDKSCNFLVNDLYENEELSHIFPINSDVLARIETSMKNSGFDISEPITVWLNPDTERYEILDGHTRVKAARNCGIKYLPCKIKNFKTKEEAIEYAHHRQRDRRNLSREELFYYATEKRNRKYGDGRDSEIKAEELGVSPRYIDNIKYIANNGTPEQIEAFKQSQKAAAALLEEIKNKQFVEDTAEDFEKDLIKAGCLDKKAVAKQKKALKIKKAEDDRRKEIEEYKLKIGSYAERLFYYALALQLDGKSPDYINETIPSVTPGVIEDLILTQSQIETIWKKFGYKWKKNY